MDFSSRVAALTSTWRAPVEFKDAEEAKRTGAMIALVPSKGWAEKLALPGREPASDLHITLAFLGKGQDYSYSQRDAIVAAMRTIAAKYAQMLLRTWSVNLFNPTSDNACVTLGITGPGLVEIREDVWVALNGMDLTIPKNHTPWVPHVTLAYTPNAMDMRLAEDRAQVGIAMFDRLCVYFGADCIEIPLPTGRSGSGASAGETKARRFWDSALHPRNFDILGRSDSHNDGQFASSRGERRDIQRQRTLARRGESDGGFTHQTSTASYPTTGFALSPYPERSKTIGGHPDMEDIRRFEIANSDLLGKENHHLGGWFDSETGTFWLDVSIVIQDRDEAARVGRQHNQIAMFDLSTFEEINIGGTGEAL